MIDLLEAISTLGPYTTLFRSAFLGQQKKGQDASAKSDARNMVSQVEACEGNHPDDKTCNADTAGDVYCSATGLQVGAGTGLVEVQAAGTDTYTIVRYAKSTRT